MGEKAELKIGDKKPALLLADQFHLQTEIDKKTHVYCYRPTCDGCQYRPICNNREVKLEVGEGFNVRRAFHARPGFKIVAIDYQQIELRIAAQLSQETEWLDAFAAGEDLHRKMAKVAFKTDDPTDRQRSDAKSVNFGAIYLCSPMTLSKQSSLSPEEAKQVLDTWWSTLKHYKAWSDQQLQSVMAQYNRGEAAYVTTITGRRRYVDGLLKQMGACEPGSKSYNSLRSRVHRIAVNSPVQGAASELMKMGINALMRWVRENDLRHDVRPLMTVHDEMVLEIRDGNDFVRYCREASSKLSLDGHPLIKDWKVKIGTDIEFGDNWAIMDKMKPDAVDAPPSPIVHQIVTPKEIVKETLGEQIIVIMADTATEDPQDLIKGKNISVAKTKDPQIVQDLDTKWYRDEPSNGDEVLDLYYYRRVGMNMRDPILCDHYEKACSYSQLENFGRRSERTKGLRAVRMSKAKFLSVLEARKTSKIKDVSYYGEMRVVTDIQGVFC